MERIKTILIDNESSALESLKWKIERHCPSLEVIHTCQKEDQAIESIKKFKPALVFIDIHLDKMTGFDLLKQLTFIHFHIIFISSDIQYIIEIMNTHAIDLLLKPVDIIDLQRAVSKVLSLKNGIHYPEKRIVFPSKQGLIFPAVNEIVSANDRGSQTKLNMSNGLKIFTKLPFKDIESILLLNHFCKIHPSWLINVKYFDRLKGRKIILSDGKSLKIAKNRKNILLTSVFRYLKNLHVT